MTFVQPTLSPNAPAQTVAQAQQFASTLAQPQVAVPQATGGFNSFGIQPAPVQQPSGGGGFSIFGWHPSIPNLGGITALKQFGSGLLGLAETPFKVMSGEENPIDVATGMAKGIGGGLASIANTAGRVVGIPGTDISLEAPLQALEKPLFGGQAPPDFFQQSKQEGPIAAFVNDALSVAAVAAPIAGGLGSAADAAEASAASLAEDAKAASAAGDTVKAADLTQQAEDASAKAAQLRPQANLAHNFAHPFGWLMDQAAGLNNAASRAAYPAVSESGAAGPSAVDIATEEAQQKAVDIAKSTLDPGVAAASAMSRSALDDAAAAAARDASASAPVGPTNQDLLNRDYPGAPTKTFYRGEPQGVEGAATGTNFHENPAYAKNFAGEGGTTYKVDLPTDAEGRPLVGEAAAKPDVGHVLPGDWADTARPVDEPAGPKASTYGTPEEAAKINEETAQARAEVPRESSVALKQARQLQLPPPAWAQRLTEALPNSVNRVLGFLAEPIDRYRMKAVARDVTRIAEVSQRATRNSPAMVESINIAKDVLRAARDAGLTPTRLNIEHMVGEEVGARLDLTQIVDQAVKDTGGNASPELVSALRDIARRGYKGIPDEIMNSLPPEQAAALNTALDSAASAWADQSMKVRQTLLASSHGAHGLEQAVLEDDNPTMTPAQTKMYKQAMRDLRREQFWRDRVPEQQARQEAEAVRQGLVADKANAEAAAARRWVGDTQAAAETLRVGVPKGIEQLDQSVAEIKAGIAGGGITYDVGLGRASEMLDSGFSVGIAPQFDVPMEEFLANGDNLIRSALTAPVSIDGDQYGQSIWAGPDARFGAWVHTGADGRQMVAGDISMGTWAGVPLTQWQASVLGETFHQEATWDNAAGHEIDMTQMPDVQNLMAHYADQALDPHSGFYKFAEGMRTAAEGADRIDPAALDAQLRFFATLDYAQSRVNPDAWKVGDFFKNVNVDFGKGAPQLPALLQTVMNIGNATDGVNAALHYLDAKTTSDALAWYYDSHDYIESAYRGKSVTLLNGTTRDAADVMYDLLAVTSQMASPKQNLGRALMGLSNMEDFLTSRRNAFDPAKPGTSAAEKLLARLDKLNPKARFDNRVVQQIVDKTGMVGNTKRLAFDVLSGRLNLETATEADIGKQPEFWGSAPKPLSTKNVPEGVSPMEYHGSTAIAKMRSFRDNLVNPHESTAVTLDSVMSRMYGFKGTDWALKGKYASYADDIRSAADMLSQRFGREVKPHEVQALLWVYTKQEIGRMDWGRLLAHHDVGQQALDSMEQHLAQGVPIDPRSFDPMSDYFDEELGYSRTRLQEQMLFRMAQKQARQYGIESLHPEDQARLARGVDQSPRLSTVEVKPDRADVSAVTPDSGTFQDRWHIPYDARNLAVQEERLQNYLVTRDHIQTALAQGDVAEARHQLTSWVVSQRRSVQGDVGGSFQKVGEETRSAPNDSAAIAEQRLAKAKRVPAPRQWAQNFISPLAARFNREQGLDAPVPVDTLAQVIPERTAAVADAVKQLAERERNGQLTPAEQAASEASYRVLQQWIDKQYAYMTGPLGLKVDYVDPAHEYGLSTLGDEPQPQPALAHAELVRDVRENNHLAVRGTALAGDGPNKYMGETAPDGLMYNDKLRAVHDFYGHAQAANDFSRHGENVAQMLHLQMFPQEAWPALFTEFRAQTAYLVDQGHFLDNQLTALLPDEMRAPDYMLRGSGDELHQRYQDTVRGATILPNDPAAKLTMRLYSNAAIDTLAHEGGHLLRQLLPPEDMAWVNEHYPHIADATLTAARVTAEEAFVSDMMGYIRDTVHGGTEAGPAADAFRKIAATMEEQVAAHQDTLAGRATNPDIKTFWDRQFNPQIVAPDKFTDPIGAQRVLPGGVETKQFRWESDAEFARRARQYGEARQAVETRQLRAQQYARKAAQVDAAARKAWAAVQAPTRAEKLADAYGARAGASLERLGAQLEDPSTGHVPAEWQPYWGAWQDLRKAALADPSGEIAQALGEIPETFSAALHYAAERGFTPTHIHDLTWERAQHFLFGHIQLVGQDVESAMRKTRSGSLSRAGLADRSLTALGAGIVDATKELYRSKLIDWVEQNYSQPLTQGASIPDGWKAWDRTRQFIMQGTDQEGNYVAPGVSRIIPAGVDKAIRDMGKSYDNWAFHMITKATSPWRTLILTLSPVWYLKHAIGNIVFASADGVRFTDWVKAFHQWRDDTLPEDVRSIHSFAQSTQAEGASSLIPGSPRQALSDEGVRAAIHEVQTRTFKVNNAINEISRAAVYERALRTGASAEAALTRAYQALGDYGDMTPFERSAIRSVVPFYTFQKQVLKLVMRFPADHPVAAAVLMQLGALHQEQMAEKLGGKLPDAYFGLADLGVLGVRNIGFADPFRDASNLLTPEGLANSFNPYLDVWLRQAYNAPASAATSKLGYGPTGKLQTQQNLNAAFGELIAGLPQVRTAQQLAQGGDVYGNSPSVAGAAAQFLGVPKAYDATKLNGIAQNVQKATTGIGAGWYPGFNAPKGTPAAQTPEAYSKAATSAGLAGTTAGARATSAHTTSSAGPSAPHIPKPHVVKPRRATFRSSVGRTRSPRVRAPHVHQPRISAPVLKAARMSTKHIRAIKRIV